MTLLAYLAGDDHAHNIRLNDIGLTTHADGSVGFGGIVFDDPDGTLLVRGWMEVMVVEDECIDAPILFRGWVGDRQYVRQGGQGQPYRSAVGRYIDTNLVDPNDALVIRLFVNPDAKRPPETDIRRINWLLGAADPGGLDGLVIDLGLVDRSSPRPFQDADWRGSYARDVLEDLAAPLGRIFFVYINQPDGTFGLFYDFPTSTVNTSSLSISNDADDTSDTCFYPFMDGNLHRDPSNMISLERFIYRNGVVLEGDTGTQTDYFSAAATGGADLGNRGDNVSNDRVGLEDTARTMADGNLNKNGIERDTLTVSIILPAAQVGFIDVGQRVAIKLTHLEMEGYAPDFVYVRVTARQIQQYVTNQNYVVTLELSNDGLRSSGGGGGTPVGDFPHPPSSPGSIIQGDWTAGNPMMPNPIQDGDTLVMGIETRGTVVSGLVPASYSVSPEGIQTVTPDQMAFIIKPSASGDTQSFVAGIGIDSAGGWWELSPGMTVTDSSSTSGSATGLPSETFSAGAVTMAQGDIALIMFLATDGGVFDSGIILDSWAWTAVAPSVEDGHGAGGSGHPGWYFAHYTATAAGSFTAQATFLEPISSGAFDWGAQVIVLHSDAVANPPIPGSEVPWETVVMTTVNGVSAGTTANPYADRSLQVKVDGNIISPASFTEDDGLCGDFHLSWEIDVGETVQVKYQGR
jgi:hypothetical protein